MPTIAAVNGAAIGAGLCLALACDLRYAAAGARLGVPFVKLGMHAGMGGTHLLPEVVGEAHARDLLLTGRVVDADEALRLGLVSRVLEPDVVPRRGARDRRRHRRPRRPIATRLTKLALRDGGHADLETALQWEAMAQPITLATEDLQEGIRASQEKRAAGVPRPLSRRHRRDDGEAPVLRRRRPAFPLRISPDGPGGLVWAQR